MLSILKRTCNALPAFVAAAITATCLSICASNIPEVRLSVFAGERQWAAFLREEESIPPVPACPLTEKKPPGVKRIVIVGDILLASWMEVLFFAKELVAADPLYPFGSTAGILGSADICAGNLESPMVDVAKSPIYSINFAGDPKRLDRLAAAGFDILSLANNHMLDRGESGLAETIRHLRKRSIRYIGAGTTYAAAYSPQVIALDDGTRIGWLGFSSTGESPKVGLPGPVMAVARTGLDVHLRSVREARPQVDFLIVFMHWGIEYAAEASPKQRALARQLVDAGADLVVGSQPHRVQEFERYKKALIVYSLGNFAFALNEISDKFAGMTSGAILQLDLLRGQLHDFEFIPILEFQGEPVPILASCADPALAKARREILASIWRGQTNPPR